MRGPCTLEGREVRVITGSGPGDEVAGLPEAEPAALAPKDMDEGAVEGDEAGAKVAFALLGGEGCGRFEEALVGPTVVVDLGMELVGGQGLQS